MLGLALTALSWMKKDLLIPGVILLAVGAGYLISSWACYRLARKQNSANQPSPENTPAS